MANVDVGLDPTTDDLPDVPETITGVTLTLQRVREEVTLIQGEWFLDLTRGLPLVEWLTTKNLDTQAALATLQARIRTIPGVITTQRASASFDNATQRLAFQFDVVTDDGAAVTVSVLEGTATQQVNGTPFLVFFRSGGLPTGPLVL